MPSQCMFESHHSSFFAYSRDKYEQLCTNVLKSIHTLPDDIIRHFLQGEWTTSLKGHKFRNLALDEAHESVINLRLKQITSRPSHFRTVELSNFMAYLDKVVNGCEHFVFKNKADTFSRTKKFICQRAARINDIIMDKGLFTYSNTVIVLENTFHSSPSSLDSATIHDLLNFYLIATEGGC